MDRSLRLGLGVVGLGTAGAAMVAVARHRSDLRLVAVADSQIDELALPELDGCRQYASLAALLEDDAVDVVHIATPTQLHFDHMLKALDAGRDVIVEKPVTVDSISAERLIAAADGRSQVIVVGHSESFEPYARAASRAVASGAIGQPLMVVAEKFTDWMRRPRLPEEWDPACGGGLIRRQGVHQIDVIRTLVGGDYEVHEAWARPDVERGSAGSYGAWLRGRVTGGIERHRVEVFMMHDGIGRLSTRSVRRGNDELSDKRARSRAQLEEALRGDAPLALGGNDAERVVVMGTAGELLASSSRVELRNAQGRQLVDLDDFPSGRDAVLDELVAAATNDRPAVHDLIWGAENLRICESVERVAGDLATAGNREAAP